MKRHPEEKITYALFGSKAELMLAFERLRRVGIAEDDISLLVSEDAHDEAFEVFERTHARDGIVAGSVFGGAMGGVIGGLVSLGAATGVGLLVMGPALALAAAGGLFGGLIGHGMPEDDAKRLRDALAQGKAAMAVHTHDNVQLTTAAAILEACHGEELEPPLPTDLQI